MSPSKTAGNVELLTVPVWTRKLKKRVTDLTGKEVRLLINAGEIKTRKNKQKVECIEFTTETAASKVLSTARKRYKNSLSKPIKEKTPPLNTNSPLPKNMMIKGQMCSVSKAFCPAVGIGVQTINRYIKDGVFKKANIRIEKIGHGTKRSHFMIEGVDLEVALKIGKILKSHKSLEDKQDLLKDLLEPDEHGLEEEDDSLEVTCEEAGEEASEKEQPLSSPVLSYKERVWDAVIELGSVLLEPFVERLKKKGKLR